MKNKYRKFFSIFLALTLLILLVKPLFSFADINRQETGSLTIIKYEQESKNTTTVSPQKEPTWTVPDGVKPLAGVTYKIVQTHEFDGREWSKVKNGYSTEKTTGTNGKIVISDLPLGRYAVQEISGPDHVYINKETFYVDIPMTYNDGKSLSYDVTIYPKNEVIRADVELIKQGEDGKKLEGVQFKLFNEDNTPVVDENGKAIELTTDENGKIKAKNLPVGKYFFQETKTIKNYALNTTKIPFEIKKTKDGKSAEVVWTKTDISSENVVTNYKIPQVQKTLENVEKYKDNEDVIYVYDITIDTPGDIENYKALGATDELDERLLFTGEWSVKGAKKENVKFTQEGQFLLWEIDDLSEISANSQIVITLKAKINPKMKDAEEGIPNIAEIYFNNGKGSYTEPPNFGPNPNGPNPEDPDSPYTPYEPGDPDKPVNEPGTTVLPKPQSPPQTPAVVVTPGKGGIKVVKIDKSNHSVKLEGAVFKITTDKAGKNVVKANVTLNNQTFNGKLENLKTNSDGEILIGKLDAGTYYLHETKAPTYKAGNGKTKSYRLLKQPVKVQVEDTVAFKEVTVENAKGLSFLPQTGGGYGLPFISMIGMALVILAAFGLYRNKKLEINE